ncbi:putative zinc-binding metallopeptidase [Archangium violaceum]|uniref:putative zinc-binding metallopeptidase n=1 Tax=Archangium violaceum TaxID=83451 RepID=UPI001EF5A64B|nr:putative zinc-binding metallopeptidase [Archangium violaceum]
MMQPPQSDLLVMREKHPTEHGEGRGKLSSQREALLQARIKDLSLRLAGTPLERHIAQLHAELEAKGISFKPQCYLSDEWGCPSGVPVIGLPFYLADPGLHSIEAELGGGVESEAEILMYLRHEAGHAINYAYRLYETDEWLRVFGDYSRPYRDNYKPQPFSRRYVLHISGWYAQKHPDEDFAETFAVWLTPNIDWRKQYQGWGALRKLQYVEETMARLGRKPPLVQLAEPDFTTEEMEGTVLDHYRQRELDEKVDVELRNAFDHILADIFYGPGEAPVRAETLIQAERQRLLSSVSQYSGVSRGAVRALLDHLAERTAALGLTLHPDDSREAAVQLTSLVTVLAMNYLYTDRFFED